MVFPDSVAFRVLAIVDVQPMRDIWLDLEKQREAEGFLSSWDSVGRWLCGFVNRSFCSGCGVMSPSLWLWGPGWARASSRSLTAWKQLFSLNVHSLIKWGLLQCYTLFQLWDYRFSFICYLICPPFYILCILLIFMSQQLIANCCTSINQSIFSGWQDEGMNERKGEVIGWDRHINKMSSGEHGG